MPVAFIALLGAAQYLQADIARSYPIERSLKIASFFIAAIMAYR